MRAAKEMNLTLLPECHCVEKWYWFDPHHQLGWARKVLLAICLCLGVVAYLRRRQCRKLSLRVSLLQDF